MTTAVYALSIWAWLIVFARILSLGNYEKGHEGAAIASLEIALLFTSALWMSYWTLTH